MTSITSTVRTHRRGLAVVSALAALALAALVLAAVALLLFKASQAYDMHHLVTSYHLPQFVRALLGAGRFGS
jgi:hypothetical protein